MVDYDKYFDLALSKEVGVYESSQGVFDDGSTQSVIGGYKVNDNAPPLKERKIDEKDKETSSEKLVLADGNFVFIRNVISHYDPKQIRAITKQLIHRFDVRAKDKKYYTHSTISNYLNDGFYGMINDTDSPILVEYIDSKGRITNKDVSVKESEYSIWALPCTPEERVKIDKLVHLMYNNKKLKYSFFKFFQLGIKSIGMRLTRSSEDVTLKDLRTKFVCSSFIAYLFNSSIERFKDKQSYLVSPNSLTIQYPMVKLYEGIYKNYTHDTNTFINKNPQYEKYLLKGFPNKL
jgi:hypothetical protein